MKRDHEGEELKLQILNFRRQKTKLWKLLDMAVASMAWMMEQLKADSP
jgi:hypothetical protein